MTDKQAQRMRNYLNTAVISGVKLLHLTTDELSGLLDELEALQSFRTAYMEWSDKTDWVQTDKRLDVIKPWGKHRADVLKLYIDHLESNLEAAEHTAAVDHEAACSLVEENEELKRKLEAAEQRNAELVHNHRVHAARLIDERGQLKQRIAELERSETQLINERDDAESALNDAYRAVMGQAPEWSNWFGFADAIDEIELVCGLWRNQTEDVIQFRQRIAELEACAYLPQPLNIRDEYQNYEYVSGWNDCRNAANVREHTTAIRDVIAERYRQQSVEGWTPEHDDEHSGGEMALAASSYALYAHRKPIAPAIPFNWPWEPVWFKQQGARRDLVKAGALILAEIERIDRAAGIGKGE